MLFFKNEKMESILLSIAVVRVRNSKVVLVPGTYTKANFIG
jgi:hypothetical protein